MYPEYDFLNLNEYDFLDDWEKSIISFLRKGTLADDKILVVCNFAPVPRYKYQLGVPCGGFWKEVLNSDAKEYGGSGHGNLGGVEAISVPDSDKNFSLTITIPPLGILFFKTENKS